jgi:hypothetical protein
MYTQGMHEIMAVLYFALAEHGDDEPIFPRSSIEPDVYFIFDAIISGLRDGFIPASMESFCT